jgi:hypothetical protein
MEDLIITSLSTGGSGGEDRLTENVSLNFAKVKVDYKEQKPRRPGRPAEMGWDIAGTQVVTGPDHEPDRALSGRQLDEAIQALGAEVRDNPTDVQRRTFLFELLCFAGAYDRADKQLDILARRGKEAEMGRSSTAARCTASAYARRCSDSGMLPDVAHRRPPSPGR